MAKQTIDWTLCYVLDDEYDLWEMETAVKAANWELFKNQLFKLYSGSTGERKYTLPYLKVLVKKWAANFIKTTEEFGTYCYDFEQLSDNHLYLCSVLGKLSIVYSHLLGSRFNLSSSRVPLDSGIV